MMNNKWLQVKEILREQGGTPMNVLWIRKMWRGGPIRIKELNYLLYQGMEKGELNRIETGDKPKWRLRFG